MASVDNRSPGGAPGNMQLQIQRLYVKDASFEAPGVPMIFDDQSSPKVKLDLDQRVTQMAEAQFEVALRITLTCMSGDNVAYVVEVDQAGQFLIDGFAAADLDGILSVYCPNALLPFARQTISAMVQAGGFPPFVIQPINFEALYVENRQRRANE